MQPEFQQSYQQKAVLTPMQIQSIKILQMDNMALTEYIKEQMLDNPVIELEPVPGADSPEILLQHKLEWLKSSSYLEKNYLHSYDDIDSSLEETIGIEDSPTLREYLLQQIKYLKIEQEQQKLITYIIDSLDTNGYLALPDIELLQQTKVSAEALKNAVSIVQGLEPAGIGARNLSNCLLLQLKKEDHLEKQIVGEYLEQLGRNSLLQIAKGLGVTFDRVREAIHKITGLNPRPGASFYPPSPPAYVIPDVIVTKFDDKYSVMLCDFSYPQIHISNEYVALLSAEDKETSDYVRRHLDRAVSLRSSIQMRNSTIFKVAEIIACRQERFFRLGPQHLSVLKQKDVAEELGLHDSTVSRAISNKYLQCSYGIYPFSHFFIKEFEGADGKEQNPSEIKTQIKDLIQSENPKSPLSDQALVQKLQAKGLFVSRRTVAKYREEMGILNSAARKYMFRKGE